MAKVIHIVREAGGVGDIIRIFSCLDGLREQCGDVAIKYHGPEYYRALMMDGHCRGMRRKGSEYHATNGRQFRPHRGAPLHPRIVDRLVSDGSGEVEVRDLYCPAWKHEQETHGAPTIERSRLFCADQTVPYHPPFCLISVTENDFAVYMQKQSARPRVALHRRPAGAIRRWPENHWRELMALIRAQGWIPLLLGETMLAWCALVSFVSSADLVIAIDSGIFNLAGALRRPVLGLFGPTNGALVSSCYSTARYIQAPTVHDCKGMCYGYNERGFVGGACVEGCVNLRSVTPREVMERAEQILEESGKCVSQ